MMSKLKKITQLITSQSTLRFLLSIPYNGYLNQIGWINAYSSKMSVDKDNKPLPWVTYSFIEFIKDRLSGLIIFEYGSGNSSYFYSDRCKELVSVEHDKNWYEKINKSMPHNMRLLYMPLDETNVYVDAVKLNPLLNYNMIIIDGRRRVACIEASINALGADGVIILDDSERVEYENGIEFLLKRNYKRLDFWGIAPGIFYNKCTSIFYKANNCLNI